MKMDLHNLPARQLAGMIKSRQASAREVVGAFLDRIEALNPTYNAIVSMLPREDILAQADAADAAVARGDTEGGEPLKCNCRSIGAEARRKAFYRKIRRKAGNPPNRSGS